MQPQTSNADQFTPKYRHFHPQSTVWVLNPFDHDVFYRVADENNNQSEFRIQAHERAELPGGSIATLGVKTIIDELIQNDKDDVLRLHDLNVRKKYEDNVILRVKDAPNAVTADSATGPIDLSIASDKKTTEVKVEEKVEKAFSELPVNPSYAKKAPNPAINKIAVASTSSKAQVVESD